MLGEVDLAAQHVLLELGSITYMVRLCYVTLRFLEDLLTNLLTVSIGLSLIAVVSRACQTLIKMTTTFYIKVSDSFYLKRIEVLKFI